MHTILPFGTRIVITSVDMHTFLGREKHPSPDDVGFTGVIVENLVEYYDDMGEQYVQKENVAPGTRVLNEDDYVFYTVIGPNGRRVCVNAYEFDVLPSLIG